MSDTLAVLTALKKSGTVLSSQNIAQQIADAVNFSQEYEQYLEAHNKHVAEHVQNLQNVQNNYSELITHLRSFADSTVYQRSYNSFPVGHLLPWLGSDAPTDNYTLCDGRQIFASSHTEFYNLFINAPYRIHLKEIYGDEDSGYIYIPMITDRFLRFNTSTAGNLKEDAIRNISGRIIDFTRNLSTSEPGGPTGPFYGENFGSQYLSGNKSGASTYPDKIHFDASRIVPTDTDNHPKEFHINLYIKVK